MIKRQPLEKHIEKTIIEYLSFKGFFVWKNHTVGIYDPGKNVFRKSVVKAGVSDILGVLPDGRFLAIEVKRKPNKPTDAQMVFIEEVNRLNGLAFVAYNIEDVKEQLLKAGYI